MFYVLPFHFQLSTNKKKGRRLATDDKKKEELITSSPLSMNNE